MKKTCAGGGIVREQKVNNKKSREGRLIFLQETAKTPLSHPKRDWRTQLKWIYSMSGDVAGYKWDKWGSKRYIGTRKEVCDSMKMEWVLMDLSTKVVKTKISNMVPVLHHMPSHEGKSNMWRCLSGRDRWFGLNRSGTGCYMPGSHKVVLWSWVVMRNMKEIETNQGRVVVSRGDCRLRWPAQENV